MLIRLPDRKVSAAQTAAHVSRRRARCSAAEYLPGPAQRSAAAAAAAPSETSEKYVNACVKKEEVLKTYDEMIEKYDKLNAEEVKFKDILKTIQKKYIGEK